MSTSYEAEMLDREIQNSVIEMKQMSQQIHELLHSFRSSAVDYQEVSRSVNYDGIKHSIYVRTHEGNTLYFYIICHLGGLIQRSHNIIQYSDIIKTLRKEINSLGKL